MRYPFTAFPDSWFRVAFSDEVSGVHGVRQLGQKLLLYRGEDGLARATSATCPHLGDGGGAWPVREVNGMIFVHPGRPSFELERVPELGQPGWSRPHRLGWTVRMHVQEIAENAVDFGHYSHVHAYVEYPRDTALSVEGHQFCVSLSANRPVLGRVVPTRIEIRYTGMGLAVARVWSPQVELVVLLTPTPVDEERLDVRMSVFFKKTGNRLRDWLIAAVLPRDIRRDFAHDIPIWENKAYLSRPVLCSGDGPIMKVRRWAEQFYGASATRWASLPSPGGTAG